MHTMRSMLLGLILVPFTSVHFIGSGIARAVTVTADGGTVFLDDFEGQTADAGLAPNGGTPGFWTVSQEDGSPDVRSTAPGAFEGSNYLAVARTGGPPIARARFGDQTDGTVLRTEAMFYIPSSGHAHQTLDIGFAPDSETGDLSADVGNLTTFYMRVDADGSVSSNGGDTGVDAPFDTWFNWTIDYTVGESTFDINVDGNPAFNLSVLDANDDPGMTIVRGSNLSEYFIDAVIPGMESSSTVFTWKANVSGDWNDRGNWTRDGTTGATLPNSSQHTAVFGDAVGSDTRNVSTDQSVTVNSMRFENSMGGNYRITGGPSINLAATTAVPAVAPTVVVSQGEPEFQARVNLLADTTADVASGATLVFNNTLDLMGNTLTKTGAGTLSIRNDLVTGGGMVSLRQGTVAGNGTVGGDLNNGGGTISPGNNSAMTNVDGGISNVPEPGGFLVKMMGLLGVLGLQRWRSIRKGG